ncbi:MAG: metal-dependent transcriptional regulator [Demequinaceae bacterium]|nr:metal-dependent transcriptional regulator [Demequinaceae bacterium]
MSDLIDTTEMYLRTVYEMIEDGVVPMRARISEQLGHSGPTVSQTVARMERDGLIVVTDGDHHLEFTATGRAIATRVMRKHRLAERLLTDVIGLDLKHVHDEACRWEHVMGDLVDEKLLHILDSPELSPYGNRIPGLEELGVGSRPSGVSSREVSVEDAAEKGVGDARLARVGEPAQSAPGVLDQMIAVGLVPGARVTIGRHPDGVSLNAGAGVVILDAVAARHVFVEPA